MSTPHGRSAPLDRLLAPTSVAVVGASNDTTRIRGKLMRNLFVSGYQGAIFPVSRTENEVQGVKAYPDVQSIGESVDLAVVAVPSAALVPALEDCVSAGAGAAVLVSSLPHGDEGLKITARLRELTATSSLRLLGPNSLGFIRPNDRIAATFAPLTADQFDGRAAGGCRISIVGQSGGTALSWLQRCQASGLNVNSVVMPGSEADITITEVLAYDLAASATDLILIFIEGVNNGPELINVLSTAADQGVPVVAMKVGSSESGQKAAMSHTGHLTGVDAAYQAVFDRYGVTRVRDTEEMVAVATAMARGRFATGKRVVVVTSGGGTGGMAADLAPAYGLEVAELPAEVQSSLAKLVPDYGSTRNPVDVGSIVEDAGLLFCQAVELCDGAPEVAGIVGAAHFGVPQMVPRMAASLQEALSATTGPILLHSTAPPSEENVRALDELGVDLYTLRGSLEALQATSAHATFQERWKSRDRANSGSRATTRSTASSLASVAAQLRLLADHGLPLAEHQLVADADEAAEAATRIGYPVVLKAASVAIPHKTELGGVALGLADESALRVAFASMEESLKSAVGDGALEGFLVQPMVEPGVEVLVGAFKDEVFGHFVTVGFGGVYAEVLRDVLTGCLPLSHQTALEMITSLKAASVLAGARNQAPRDIDALADVMVNLGELVIANPHISEVDLNPVVVYPEGSGAVVVDALIVGSAGAAED